MITRRGVFPSMYAIGGTVRASFELLSSSFIERHLGQLKPKSYPRYHVAIFACTLFGLDRA